MGDRGCGVGGFFRGNSTILFFIILFLLLFDGGGISHGGFGC